jgi:TonB family protein
LFISFKEKLKFPPPQSQEKKISLNLQHFVTPPPAQKSVTPPTPVIKEEPKPEASVQTAQKKVLDESSKTFAVKNDDENNVTKTLPKASKKVVKKEVKKPARKVVKKVVKQTKPQPKRVVQKTPARRLARPSNSALAKSLLAQASSLSPVPSRVSASGGYVSQMIKQLYGGEFNSYSPAQKEFIKNNLGTIHQITQRTLTLNGYPDIAIRTRQQGTNVVSFYLHPNGDITDLRLKRRIGYESLDQNTLEVIRIAYKDYPLPNKKTKIMFYVQYSLF